MIEKYPLLNEYWADKRARIDRIECPVYALASYSTGLHTFGSFRGFTDVPHEQKWCVNDFLPFTILSLIDQPGFGYTPPRSGTTCIKNGPMMTCSAFSTVILRIYPIVGSRHPGFGRRSWDTIRHVSTIIRRYVGLQIPGKRD
jgi:hypothetical protein